MTATNHALTGALIGLSVVSPAALLLAVGSHFVLDAVPHYADERVSFRSKRFVLQLALDLTLCIGLALFLALTRPDQWLLAVICAFLATSPDLMWMPRFIHALRKQTEPKTKNLIVRFHGAIQWFERPIGIVVELAWCAGSIVLLAKLI